jgi:hypothetical protein
MNDPRQDPKPDLDALFALARKQRPDTSRAEYAFETRLMARLHNSRQPETSSIWAKVSWRMIPLFAICVLALGLWRTEVVSEADDTADMANVDHPEAVDLLNTFN